MLTLDTMERLWPNGNDRIMGLREGIVDAAPQVTQDYKLDSDLVLAHFMAQVSHECGAGLEVVENLNYSARRMMEVWPSRFPTLSSTSGYARNPRALANKVYNGRMGNRLGTDDGWNYRGRGATQTTGREGYQALQDEVDLPLLEKPELVNDKDKFLLCGAADFVECGCLAPAQADNVRQVTRLLNGGYIGLNQRIEWLTRWKSEFKRHTMKEISRRYKLTAPTGKKETGTMDQYIPTAEQIASIVKWTATMFCGYAINRGWMSSDMTEAAVGAAVSIALLALGIYQHSIAVKIKNVAAINPGIQIIVPKEAMANKSVAAVVNDMDIPQIRQGDF